MTRKKVILLAIVATAVVVGARHCMKTMAGSRAPGELIDICSRHGAGGCGSREKAEKAGAETAAVAA